MSFSIKNLSVTRWFALRIANYRKTMKPLSEIYKELGIAFSFPIEIEDDDGNLTYFENSDNSDNYWQKCEYDANGNETYHEDSNNYWERFERDDKGDVDYYENSNEFWCRWGRDDKGRETYFENSVGIKRGTPKSAKTCEGKVVEVDGIKYKLTAQK